MADILKDIRISGSIQFQSDAPPSPLPNPSILTVKLEDCRLCGAPAIRLGEVQIEAHEVYAENQPLKFSIPIKEIGCCPEYSVSAVLNIGWRPHGDEWIRKGDYLNDTCHNLEIMDIQKKDFFKDVAVIHYK